MKTFLIKKNNPKDITTLPSLKTFDHYLNDIIVLMGLKPKETRYLNKNLSQKYIQQIMTIYLSIARNHGDIKRLKKEYCIIKTFLTYSHCLRINKIKTENEMNLFLRLMKHSFNTVKSDQEIKNIMKMSVDEFIIASNIFHSLSEDYIKFFISAIKFSINRIDMFNFNNKKYDQTSVKKDSYINFSKEQREHVETMFTILPINTISRKEILNLATSTIGSPWLKDEPKLNAIQKTNLTLRYAILIFWAVVILYPVYILISTSFNTNVKLNLNPGKFTFGFTNFSYLFSETLFTTWILNTLIVSVSTMLIVVSFTCLMAYAYSRYRFRAKKPTMVGIIILQMFPTIAALPVFIAYYTILKQQAGFSPLIVLILIYAGGGIFGNTFVLKGYMDGISTEIDDASKIDGCSSMKTFTKVIFPLTKPMLAVVALWSFIGPFGDFILPSVLIDSIESQTVAVGIRTLIRPSGQDTSKVNFGSYTAASILISVPIVLLFLYLQKFIRGGRTAGGVK